MQQEYFILFGNADLSHNQFSYYLKQFSCILKNLIFASNKSISPFSAMLTKVTINLLLFEAVQLYIKDSHFSMQYEYFIIFGNADLSHNQFSYYLRQFSCTLKNLTFPSNKSMSSFSAMLTKVTINLLLFEAVQLYIKESHFPKQQEYFILFGSADLSHIQFFFFFY